MTYINELLDVRWINKRQRILRRDHFMCTVCGSRDSLRVHHTFYYQKKVKPWEYPSRSLITLCDKCHYEWHLHHENVYKANPVKKAKKKIKRDKKTLWIAEIMKHPYKNYGIRYIKAKTKEDAISLLKSQGFPVYHIDKFIK